MQNRVEYYDRLQAVRDAGDWEGWLAFFLRGVESVGNEAAATVRRILELREAHRAAVTGRLGRGAANGHRALEGLYRRPYAKVSDIQEMTGLKSPVAANALATRLVSIGVLEQPLRRRRNRLFAYRQYIRIFEDGPE